MLEETDKAFLLAYLLRGAKIAAINSKRAKRMGAKNDAAALMALSQRLFKISNNLRNY
jgi:hypothetical protein